MGPRLHFIKVFTFVDTHGRRRKKNWLPSDLATGCLALEKWTAFKKYKDKLARPALSSRINDVDTSAPLSFFILFFYLNLKFRLAPIIDTDPDNLSARFSNPLCAVSLNVKGRATQLHECCVLLLPGAQDCPRRYPSPAQVINFLPN